MGLVLVLRIHELIRFSLEEIYECGVFFKLQRQHCTKCYLKYPLSVYTIIQYSHVTPPPFQVLQTVKLHRRSWHGITTPLFFNFLLTYLFSITLLYFFIISSLFPYFNLFVSILIQSYISSNLHVSILYIQLHVLHIKTTNYVKNGTIGVDTIDVTTTLQQNSEHVHQQ